jgi:hypothetical protein
MPGWYALSQRSASAVKYNTRCLAATNEICAAPTFPTKVSFVCSYVRLKLFLYYLEIWPYWQLEENSQHFINIFSTLCRSPSSHTSSSLHTVKHYTCAFRLTERHFLSSAHCQSVALLPPAYKFLSNLPQLCWVCNRGIMNRFISSHHHHKTSTRERWNWNS